MINGSTKVDKIGIVLMILSYKKERRFGQQNHS